MIIRGRVPLGLVSLDLEEGLGQCSRWLHLGALKTLIFISSPGDANKYPKLKITGLGSILREVCTRDKECCP